MSRNEAVSVVSFILSSFGLNNGIQLATFGLLTDRTSSIYLKVIRLKALASVIVLSLIRFCINSAS
jgi:hypothetical protein